MARKVRLTEAQKVNLRILNRGEEVGYMRDSPTQKKLIELGFAETVLAAGDFCHRVDLRITPEGRAYVHGAHK